VTVRTAKDPLRHRHFPVVLAGFESIAIGTIFTYRQTRITPTSITSAPFDLHSISSTTFEDCIKCACACLEEKLRALIEKSGLPGVICGKYVEGRGVHLFNEVVRRNLEGGLAKRNTGTYATVSGWLKIKNPNYTQSERRYELFESFKAKQTKRVLPPISKKPPLRAIPVTSKKAGKSRRTR
jgi:hypothetical protein